MKISYLTFVFLFISNSIVFTQPLNNQIFKSTEYDKIVHLELLDNKYECLSMIAIRYKSKNNEYKGKSSDGRNWFFHIPDSVFNKSLGIAFRNFSAKDREAVKMINLCYIQHNDTFMTPHFINFQNSNNIDLKLKYLKRDSIQTYHRDSLGNVKLTKFVHDFYTIKNPDIENILSICESSNFCWFNPNRNPNKTYEEFLTEYVSLIKQYPHSKTLMSMLLDHFDGGRFKSKENIMFLFNSFSVPNKNSYLGQLLNRELSLILPSSKFENFNLQNSITHNFEPIITDSTKFNLIIFSASWCSPCHKLIPQLKEINTDLHKNMNLIYISLDEKATLKQWEDLLHKENIIWRSLSAFNNLELIKMKFLAWSIPKLILVYPDGKMEYLDIRVSNDKERLYKLVLGK